MPNKCAVPGCKTGYASCKIKLSTFSAPKNEEIRVKWQKAICSKKPLTSNHVVCEKHFTTDEIIRNYTLKDDCGKVLAEVPLKCVRLIPNAIPTKLLHQNVDRDESSKKENLCPDKNVLPPSNAHEELSDFNNIHTNEKLGIPTTKDNVRIDVAMKVESRSSQTAAESSIKSDLFKELLAKFSVEQLPENWYVAKPSTHELLAFYEIFWKNEDNTLLPITRRSLTIDKNMKARYSVYRRFINPLEYFLPDRFESLEIIRKTIERFASLKICCGIGIFADVNLMKGKIGYTDDDDDQLRHTRCSIITDKSQCDACKRVKKSIHQKKLRMKKREEIVNDEKKNDGKTKSGRNILKNENKSLKQTTSLDALLKRAQRCAMKRAQKKNSRSKECNAGTARRGE